MIRLAAAAILLATLSQASVDAPPVRIHYWPEQEALAQRIARGLPDSLRFPGLPPGVLEPGGVDVWLAPDQARWDSLTGGAAPEWGAGVADPVAGVIVLPTFDWQRTPLRDLGRTLRHELAHVALQRHLGDTRTPRWFTEGYAQWAAGEWSTDSAWQLRLGLMSGNAPPLDSLTLDWPRSEADARLAYLLSASAVAYLVDRSGERGLRVLFRRWKDSGDFQQSFRSTYGLTMGQFEEDWREFARKRYGWGVFLGQWAFFWILAAALLVVFVVVRRRRDRERLARLRATEPPDRPAYWDGEVPDEPPPDNDP